MAVRYDLYETPSPQGNKEKRKYHARVIPFETMDTDRLARIINDDCSLTEPDVKAVLMALRHAVIDQLKNGNRVYIEGLGYFQMTLKCPPIHSVNEIRAESVSFKSVSFLPEKRLKKELAGSSFVRAGYKKHSKKLSDDAVGELLTEYFSEHAYIIRSDFERLCGFTRSKATLQLNRLIEQGKLKKGGIYRFPVYEPVNGSFGR